MKWRNAKVDKAFLGTTEEDFLRAARQYVASAYPNPDRVGCPGRDRLEALARHEWQHDDFLQNVEHVVNCSACFVEYHAIRKARKRKRAAVAGITGGVLLTLLVFSFITLISRHRTDIAAPLRTPAPVAREEARNVAVDLRPIEPNRGELSTERHKSVGHIVLHRANVTLSIQLPIGSEEGEYLVQVHDLAGTARLDASGNAVIRNYVTTLEVPLDLRALTPGQFKLTVRRPGMEALSCPVEVR